VLLTARKILLIHFLMRLPDFVKPVVAAADRFIRTLQKDKLFVAFSATALARQGGTVRRSAPHRRYLTSQRLPRSKTKEG
jgi:hypothetical protein